MDTINKKSLNKVVDYYKKHNDLKHARIYIESWGPQIEDYNISKALEELDKPIKKESKKVKPKVESKSDIKKEE